MRDAIQIENARVHNLKGINLAIPRDRVVVFTGVSGSGKSSLVFDTLHTEAQRQLIETFSSFARRRLPKLSRPEVDAIHNLSTSIVIDQHRLGRTLRSTVGTATEVYTYLRLLYSRCGDTPGLASFHFGFNHPEGMCPACKGLGKRITVDTERMLDKTKSLRDGAITHPDYRVGGWNWRELVGIDLFDVSQPLREFAPAELEKLLFAEGIPIVKKHGAGTYAKTWVGIARRLERLYVNNAEDELSESRRDAYRQYLVYGECAACGGLRLNPARLAVRLAGKGIGEAVQMELTDLDAWLGTIDGPVAEPLVHKMRSILSHLIGIGVGYLSLNRAVSTLSGGESQRLKMARQLDCDLVGLMYVLDEPSIGLHARDIDQLIAMLGHLRDQGNSVLVVEHDPAIIAAADYVVEIGPGPGRHGGEVCFVGERAAFLQSGCRTATLMRQGHTPLGAPRRNWSQSWPIRGARVNNLRGVDVDIPQRVLVCITGVAGQRQEQPRARGVRADGPERRGRGPEPHRAEQPVQSRHLPGRVRRRAASLRPRHRQAGFLLQLQFRRRLPGLQRAGHHRRRDALPGRRPHPLLRLQRPALHGRGAGAALAGPQHPPGAGHDRAGSRGRLHPAARQGGARAAVRGGPGLPHARPAAHDSLRRRMPAAQAGRRAGQGRPGLHPG